jgi:hypothetical protein
MPQLSLRAFAAYDRVKPTYLHGTKSSTTVTFVAAEHYRKAYVPFMPRSYRTVRSAITTRYVRVQPFSDRRLGLENTNKESFYIFRQR